MSNDERMWSVPVDAWLDSTLHHACQRQHRTKASFIRTCVLRQLQAMGMVDADMKPIPQEKWPSSAVSVSRGESHGIPPG